MRHSIGSQSDRSRRGNWARLVLVVFAALATSVLTTGAAVRALPVRLSTEESRGEQESQPDDGAQREMTPALSHREGRRCPVKSAAFGLPLGKRLLDLCGVILPSAAHSLSACSEHELRNGLGIPLRI